MYLIDINNHIYLPEVDNDREDMMKRAAKEGVEALILPAIDSTTHPVMMEMVALYPSCHSMFGLHPGSVNQDFTKELAIITDLMAQRGFFAIGEIGLDFYW